MKKLTILITALGFLLYVPLANACEIEWNDLPDNYCDQSTRYDYVGYLAKDGFEIEILDTAPGDFIAIVYDKYESNNQCVNTSLKNRGLIYEALCDDTVKVGCGFIAGCIDWAASWGPICQGVWVLTNIALNDICD